MPLKLERNTGVSPRGNKILRVQAIDENTRTIIAAVTVPSKELNVKRRCARVDLHVALGSGLILPRSERILGCEALGAQTCRSTLLNVRGLTHRRRELVLEKLEKVLSREIERRSWS